MLHVPSSTGHTVLPKAVDRFGPDVLSASWAELGEDKSTLMNKQGALRALAALAHASLTSKPGEGSPLLAPPPRALQCLNTLVWCAEDATYVGGLFVTLQSLLDSLDAIRASWKSSLAGFIAGRTGGTGGAPAVPLSKKKNSLADFRARMELWALMRIAFSAARVALSKSGISKIAIRSFSGRIRLGRCGALLLMPAVVRQVPAAPTRCVRGTRWPLRLWRRGTDRLPRPTSQRCSRLWQGTWTWPGGQVCRKKKDGGGFINPLTSAPFRPALPRRCFRRPVQVPPCGCSTHSAT